MQELLKNFVTLVTDARPEKPGARRGCGSCSPVVHIPFSVLLDLIDGMRDPSHVEARKLALKTARLGVPSLLQEVSGLCLEETQTKTIDRTLVVSRAARANSWRCPVDRCCSRKAWQGQFGTGAARAGHRHMPLKLVAEQMHPPHVNMATAAWVLPSAANWCGPWVGALIQSAGWAKAAPSRLSRRGRHKDAREKTRRQASRRRFCGKIH